MTFSRRRNNSRGAIQTMGYYILKVCKLQRVVLSIIIFLSLFHVFRQFGGGRFVYETTDVVPAKVSKVYERLQNAQNKKTQFHGGHAITETEKFKDLLLLTEKKVVKQIKEGYHSNKSEDNLWILCSKSKPDDERFWPTIGNGHLATVVRSNTVFMNGLYNGKGTFTHRARIPAFIAFQFVNASLPITEESYCLNMQTGMYSEVYKGDHWNLTVKMYAHRSFTRLLVTEMILYTDGKDSIKIDFYQNQGPPSTDLLFDGGTSKTPNSRYVYGSNLSPEIPSEGKTPIHIYYSSYPSSFDIRKGTPNSFTKIYLMSASPFNKEADSAFEQGLEMYREGTLETSHIKAWQEVWDAGRIDIYGNSHLASSAYSSLYYILSAMPIVEEVSWPFIGLSPGDLAHGAENKDYNGHVFWDQDTWMYPPILVLNTSLGKTLVSTRLRTLDNAYVNAKERGLKGAMYPWESAYEGLNVSPAPETTKYEIHVTGDVAFGFQQYLMMSGETDLLKSGRLKEAIGAMADFWQSRVTYNGTRDKYELYNVMPPDEWNWPVNNSVYTNQLVKISLLLPKYAYSLIGEKAPEKYEEIAQKMLIVEDEKLKYHPEFDGYDLKIAVKQADVVLLGFPLDMPMPNEFRMNDLTFYEKVTPGGPAMTWGIYAVGWIEMGQPEKAERLFSKQLLNQQEPFNVWTETASGLGATNFITGQGGFLQSIIFGYGGLRIAADHIAIKCTSIPWTDSFRIKNMDYLGNSLDILCGGLNIEVTLTFSKVPLTLQVVPDGKKYQLQLGKTVSLSNVKFIITAASSNNL